MSWIKRGEADDGGHLRFILSVDHFCGPVIELCNSCFSPRNHTELSCASHRTMQPTGGRRMSEMMKESSELVLSGRTASVSHFGASAHAAKAE